MPRPSKPPVAPTGPRLVKRTPSKPSAPVPPEITHEQIAMRAYQLFEQEGCVHGRHNDHWLRAERELLKEVTQLPSARVATTRARG